MTTETNHTETSEKLIRFLPGNQAHRVPRPDDFQPELIFPNDWKNEKYRGIKRCIAWNSRRGQQCEHASLRGKNVCRNHGGLSRRGILAPNFKTGRYSKDLPTRLIANYEAFLSDPELLSIRESIALYDARLLDLFKRVDTGESGKLWSDTAAAWKMLKEAMKNQDIQQTAAAIDILNDKISGGHTDYLAWREIYVVLEQRRKTAESERKRLIEMNQMITADKAMVLVSAIIDLVRKNINDRDTLARISTEISVLIER
jgi:hypothetical protein